MARSDLKQPAQSRGKQPDLALVLGVQALRESGLLDLRSVAAHGALPFGADALPRFAWWRVAEIAEAQPGQVLAAGAVVHYGDAAGFAAEVVCPLAYRG